MFLKVFGSLVLGIFASQAYAIQFHYDSLGRLIKSQLPKEENAALMQVYYGQDAASNIVKVTNEPEGKLPSGVTLSFQQKTTQNFSQLALQWQTSVDAPGIIYDLYLSEDPYPTLYKSNLITTALTLDMYEADKPLYVQVIARDYYGAQAASEIQKLLPLDSDGDSIPDHIEIPSCTNHLSNDSDGDGLIDDLEAGFGSETALSNPCSSDTDSDGVDDGFEHQQGWDLQQPDTSTVNEEGVSHWAQYVKANAQKAAEQGIAVVEGERVLDVVGKPAFAYTGVAPAGDASMTMMYWVKFHQVDNQAQLSGADDGQEHAFYAGINQFGKAVAGVGSYYTSYDKEKIQPNVWMHIAVVFDQAEKLRVLYVNGIEQDRDSYVKFEGASQRSLMIGALSSFGGAKDFQDAQLDEVQIWSTALDGSSIQSYMLTPPKKGSVGLTAYYDFSRSRGIWVENRVTGEFDTKLSEDGLFSDADAFSDRDGDGLSDQEELALCSDPDVIDSDNDGLSDGIEMGVEPGAQTGRVIGNPCAVDTDSDGIDDAFEYQQGWNLQESDVSKVNEEGVSHWTQYVKASAQKAIEQGESIIEGEHVLDVVGKSAFAFTGIVPSGNTSMTMMYWAKFSQTTSGDQHSGADDGQDHVLYAGINQFSNAIGGVGSSYSTSYEETFQPNVWMHLAVVYDQAEKQRVLYVNGIEQDRDSYMRFEGTSQRSLMFGALSGVEGATDFQDAQLDDVQVWSTALDGASIQSYMSTPPLPGESGLKAHYNFSRYRGLWVANQATGEFDMKLSQPEIIRVKQ